jgi:DNA-binding transcriptional LysR family regulator
MDDKDWLILKTIHEEQSLTKAAERLFISQPALSYRLQNLEKDFGVKFMNRHANGVYFTPQGEYLLRYAQEMLTKLEDVRENVRNLGAPLQQGTLRLGVSSVIAKFKMAPLLKSFNKHFPDVEVLLRTGSSALQLPAMLQNKEVDIALLRGDINWPENKHVIAEEPMCIVSSHSISLDQLPNMPWINYESSSITGSIEQLCLWWNELYHSPLPRAIQVDSIEACIQMVSHGLGWCVVPKIHVVSHRSLSSHPVTWRDGHTMVRKTIMLYGAEAAKSAVSKLFIDHVLRNYRG